MKRLWLMFAAIALVSTVSARGGQGRIERVVRSVLRNPDVAARVGIEEKAVNRLRQAYFAHRKKVARLQGQLRLAEIELQEARTAAQPDLDEIDARIEKIGSLRTELQKSRVRFELRLREILGPEALSKLRRAACRGPAKRIHRRWRGHRGFRAGDGPLAESMGDGPRGEGDIPEDLIVPPET
ncbi:MAG: hypothetical protein DRP22_01310 [Verrucomicrobia bacterium]|nr:MAG: hypothetical protein DRP22_01310 [Verrucomicrobiota bacterium]